MGHLVARESAVTVSFVAVRISTGRRHQIRSHFSHVGHPTLRDRLYTARTSFHADRLLCACNWLHRYRLAFCDSAGVGREVVMPLLLELSWAMGKFSARDIESADGVRSWLHTQALPSWDDCVHLAPRQQAQCLESSVTARGIGAY